MNCHTHHDALVDLARGVAVAPDVERAAREHAAACARCAARLQRESHLTSGLRALAARDAQAAPSVDVEAALMAAFDATVTTAPAAPRTRGRVRMVVAALAAAAALVLAVYAARSFSSADLVGGGVSRAEDRGAKAPRNDERLPVESTRMASASAPAPAPAPSPSQRPKPRPQAPPAATPLEFHLVPGAAALPAFESGHIVRMELPVSALPSYGVEIVPDSAREEVTADLLVGQDGHPRGIRLVPQKQ